ncbi:MAG: hypothetical protein HY658_03130 [Actinobacteria bacterium]|nr:hypothetical protein [Actinomycetota bacterium]
MAGSLSPAIHAAAFAAHDLDWAYLPSRSVRTTSRPRWPASPPSGSPGPT